MQPSRSGEFMSEINRLFPNMNKESENDVFHMDSMSSRYGFSPLNQTFTNRSSSSDSTSPEYYPEYPSFRPATPGYSTPMSFRHEPTKLRAITGRKLINKFDLTPIESPRLKPERNYEESDPLYFSYATDDSVFLHTSNDMPKKESNQPQNVLYELFPTDNKGFEFKTPLKQASPQASQNLAGYNSYSPFSTNMSPSLNNMSLSQNMSPQSPSISSYSHIMSPLSPIMSPLSLEMSSNYSNIHNFANQFPNFPTCRNINSPNTSDISNLLIPSIQSNRRFNQVPPGKLCTFCRKNGETPMVYSDHAVKELIGGRYVVTCPILRCHICSTCGATGDNAHTITYCPILKNTNHGRPLQSTTITLKNTRVKSNGKKRY